MAIDTIKWNGSAWVTAPVRKWNGSAWVDAYVRKWNGSTWVQMYPETVVTHTQYIYSTGPNNYKGGWENAGVAKQGNWGYGNCYGYLGLAASQFTGAGTVTEVTGSGFNGVRDGSGYYNNNQTIRFFRSNVNSTSQNPTSTVTGEFTSTTGAPGSGRNMPSRPISGYGAVRDWMNSVNGKPYLYIYDTSKSLYLGITQNSSWSLNIGFDYKYTARTVSFASPFMMLMATPDMYTNLMGRQPYHSMVIYEDEEGMSLPEIMKRREDGIVEPIDKSSADFISEIMPYTKEYDVYKEKNPITDELENKFKIEVLKLRENDLVQFSLDKLIWTNMSAIYERHDFMMYGTLPKDFNMYSDKVYMRVYDKVTDSVVLEKTIDPKILIPGQDSGIILPGQEVDLNNFSDFLNK